MQLFDRRLHALKKNKAQHTLAEASFLAEEIENTLWQRVDQLKRPFNSVCILGCPLGNFKQQFTNASPNTPYTEALSVDRETLPFQSQSFDLVIDGFGLHWVNNIPQALLEVRRIMAPGGVYLAGFLGEHTLKELRQVLIKTDLSFFSGAYARVSPFLKLQTISELLMAVGFHNPVVAHEELEVHYPSLFELVLDLRRMGETNCLTGKEAPYRRNYFKKADSIYKELYTIRQENIKATFDCVYLIAENTKGDIRKES